jgi:hypothetical protein
MPFKIQTLALIILFLFGSIALSSCANSKSGSANEPLTTQVTPVPPPKTEFEQDLDFVRKGQYTYVWVLARKDGKPLDSDDGAFLRRAAPQVVDWVTTDKGKRVIAGTNFNLEEGNLEVLKKRYDVEDYTGK